MFGTNWSWSKVFLPLSSFFDEPKSQSKWVGKRVTALVTKKGNDMGKFTAIGIVQRDEGYQLVITPEHIVGDDVRDVFAQPSDVFEIHE